jgi:hypothetical protein
LEIEGSNGGKDGQSSFLGTGENLYKVLTILKLVANIGKRAIPDVPESNLEGVKGTTIYIQP